MYSKLIADFNLKIVDLKSETNFDLKYAIEGIQLCRHTLNELNVLIDRNGFGSATEEIYFFKEVKVQPLSYLVYFNEIRLCILSMPKLGVKDKLSYLNKKVRKINKFFVKNLDFVQYMEQEHDYMDLKYFTRKNNVIPLNALPDAIYYNPDYSTAHDVLLAKIKGLNEFTVYLRELIKTIKYEARQAANHRNKGRQLVWTESKVALAELIYALYTSDAINNGKEGIKGISTAFEEVFNVKLDNIYKTYSEIKMRKGSKSKFLEELTTSLNHKIENDDAF